MTANQVNVSECLVMFCECTVMMFLLSVGVVDPPISEPPSAPLQPEQVQGENEAELVAGGFPDKQVQLAEQEVGERDEVGDTKLLGPDQQSTESEEQVESQLKLEGGDEQAMETSTSAPNMGECLIQVLYLDVCHYCVTFTNQSAVKQCKVQNYSQLVMKERWWRCSQHLVVSQ